MPLFSSQRSLGDKVHRAVGKNEVRKLQNMLLDDSLGTVAERKAAIEHPDGQGRTPLMRSAAMGNYMMTKLLVQAGANVNRMNNVKDGSTALHNCAINGSESVAKMLVAVGADPFMENCKGQTPLQYAINRGQTPLVRIFEDKALFSGWLFIKMKRYQGVSRHWKVRWVSVFQQNTRRGRQGASKLILNIYKSYQAFRPCSSFRVDGARAFVVARPARNNPSTPTLQCMVTLAAGQQEPPGISVRGNDNTGFMFEVRPVCTVDGPEEQREAAWSFVVSFVNAINKPLTANTALYRENNSDVGEASSLLQRRASDGSAMQAPPEMAPGSHVRSASEPPMQRSGDAIAAEDQQSGEAPMSDEQLARWLQNEYSRGSTTPRLVMAWPNAMPDGSSMEASSEGGPGEGSCSMAAHEASQAELQGEEAVPPTAPPMAQQGPGPSGIQAAAAVPVVAEDATRKTGVAEKVPGTPMPFIVPPLTFACPAQTPSDKGKAPMQPTDEMEAMCVICLENPRSAGFVHGDR
mmetsp:Transcript_20568/g.57059  ORF Transcript_20568/g.57059 Transcript_20568/m.57059 type:complete len:520 (-) Transcript_20568:205-1764(-)